MDGYATGTAGAVPEIVNSDVSDKLIQTKLSKIDMRTPEKLCKN
jgi:hypothetical protein